MDDHQEKPPLAPQIASSLSSVICDRLTGLRHKGIVEQVKTSASLKYTALVKVKYTALVKVKAVRGFTNILHLSADLL